MRVHPHSISLCNRRVATIDQIYRDNLRALIKEHGTQEALSTVIGKSPAQISQWLNGLKDSKTGKPRSMARATAREIERACGKPEGWMDQPHEAEAVELLDIFSQLSAHGRSALTQSARTVLTAETLTAAARTATERAATDKRATEPAPPSSIRRKRPA